MAAITKISAKNVKKLVGSVHHRIQLGATVTAPSPVTEQSDGKWDGTDTSAAQLTAMVALQSGVDGDWIDAVSHGPIEALSGATAGTLVYGSDTAGAFDTAAGTKGLVIGYAGSASVLVVAPQIIDFS
ncbi:MAG: hypothetical protein GY927_03900 [bacterium]|nr:hypothetical protein [bacterium]